MRTLKCQGHPKSNLIVPLDSPYAVFCWRFSSMWPNLAYLRDILGLRIRATVVWIFQGHDQGQMWMVPRTALPMYGFLLMANSNTWWPNSAALRGIRLWNLSDLHLDVYKRSLKVKCDGVIGLPINAFLMRVDSNTGPNSALLRDVRL